MSPSTRCPQSQVTFGLVRLASSRVRPHRQQRVVGLAYAIARMRAAARLYAGLEWWGLLAKLTPWGLKTEWSRLKMLET